MALGEESPPHSKYYDVLKMGWGDESPPHSKYYDVLKMGGETSPHPILSTTMCDITCGGVRSDFKYQKCTRMYKSAQDCTGVHKMLQ